MQNLTTAQINAVATLLTAKAYVQTITPIVRAYENKVLNENAFYVEYQDYKKCYMQPEDKIRVTDPENIFEMSEADILEYVRLCRIEMLTTTNLTAPEECCPLLITDSNVVKAQWAVFEAYKPIHKIASQPTDMDNYKKLLDLTVTLCLTYCRENKINIHAVAMPSN